MSADTADPQAIQSIPSALLKTLPAGQPPPGVQPNFADPPSRAPVILGVCLTFAVLAVICFSIRIYTKLAIAKNWKWDDLTCSLGYMCSIVYLAAVVIGCIHGAAGRHIWDVYLDRTLGKSSLYSYITTIMVTPALGLIKSSLFIQYYLLFKPLRWVRVSVWIGGTITALFYVSVTITALVLNSPWPGESLLEDLISWHYLKFAEFSIPTGVIGMLVDWYLFILPIPAVLTLQMSWAKKLGVLIIFMTGGLAAIASIVSLYYRVQLQNNLSDATWNVGYVLLWAQIEMFAGVSASSMPTVNQFFTRRRFSLMSWISSLKSSLTHLLSSSPSEKITSYDPSFLERPGSNRDIPEDQGYKLKDLEVDGRKRKAAKPHQPGDSQIYLTEDISIISEQVNETLVQAHGHRSQSLTVLAKSKKQDPTHE